MCSLRFDVEENTIIEAFIRFRFASVAITISDDIFQGRKTLDMVWKGNGCWCFYPRCYNVQNYSAALIVFAPF